MRLSRLNPTLELDSVDKDLQAMTTHLTDTLQKVDAATDLTDEEKDSIRAHEVMHAQTYLDHKFAEALPEPMGGHRANLILFSVRAHLNGIDKGPEWAEALRREIHYQNLRILMRGQSRQSGKDGIRTMLTGWLDYLQQVSGAPTNGN